MQACAAHQDACQGFGGDDPWSEFDQLLDRLDAAPIPATGDDARPVDGDDAPAAAVQAVYAKQLWPVLAAALASADRGDGTGLRALADFFYGWLPGGTYDPLLDRYFTISALEQRYLSKVRRYLREGRRSYRSYDHA
jgi:hypothetical protein